MTSAFFVCFTAHNSAVRVNCPSSHHVFSWPSLTYCTSKVERLDNVALKVDDKAVQKRVCLCGLQLKSSTSLLCPSVGETL